MIIIIYLFSNNNMLNRLIVDLKISFKKTYRHFLDEHYICFSFYCNNSFYKCEDISNDIDSD